MNAVDRTTGIATQPGLVGGGVGVESRKFGDSLVNVSGATPFAGVVQSIVNQTKTLSKDASDAVSGLLDGKGVEIHDVIIAQQKASASFELALQVRNKAVAAYQQMMGMQF